ncbi:hypothetical protein D9757_010311 [Collybiopsis confluens]|uniref:Uncharacterized protein n=1 Tax=Collybiopsis confluens TaxID=2823264 RepID=A0A8H5GTR2_9AGAR|nr:hypothetical protein D9757_010311 [Collybiopsis confluens]
MSKSNDSSSNMAIILARALEDSQNRVVKLGQELRAAKAFEAENSVLHLQITQLKESAIVKKEERFDSSLEFKDTATVAELKMNLAREQEKSQQLQNNMSKYVKRSEEVEAKLIALQVKYQKIKTSRKRTHGELQELQTKITSLEETFISMQSQDGQPNGILAKIQTHLQFLPCIPRAARRLIYGPKLSRDLNMLTYLKLAVPETQWSKQLFFFSPRSISVQCGSNQHYLTCSPVTETIPGTTFTIQYPYENLDGQIVQYFTTRAGTAAYAGVYKCVRTRDLAPEGLALPPGLPVGPVAYEASEWLSNTKEPKAGFPSIEDLKKMYKSGELKVEFTIFQCVGYNQSLADSLIRYETNRGYQPKRPREEDAVGEGIAQTRSDSSALTRGQFGEERPSKRNRTSCKRALKSDTQSAESSSESD